MTSKYFCISLAFAYLTIESLFSYSRRHLQEQEDTLKKLMENRQIQQMKELETLFEKYVKLQVTISFYHTSFI